MRPTAEHRPTTAFGLRVPLAATAVVLFAGSLAAVAHAAAVPGPSDPDAGAAGPPGPQEADTLGLPRAGTAPALGEFVRLGREMEG